MRTRPPPWRRAWRPLLAAGLVGGASAARASVWETPNWALTSTLTGAVGYDSNLTVSHDGPDDGFVRATPEATLLRRNSTTDLTFTGRITGTHYFHERQPTQADYYLRGRYGYPLAKDTLPLYTADVSWQRVSEPNQYLARRVRHDRATLAGEGYMPLSGKFGLHAQADAYSDDFDDPTLNHNTRYRAFAGVSYDLRPRLKTALNIGGARGRSEPNFTGGSVVKSKELYLTARVRGEITAKLTGQMYAGWSRVTYEGGYANRHNLPVAGADLTWGIDPRRTVVLALYRGADYAPDGQAVEATKAFLSFTHVLINRWQYIVRGGPTHSVLRREVRQGTDDTWEGGIEFNYMPSERFRIGAGVTHTWQNSDASDRKYDRTTITLESTLRL